MTNISSYQKVNMKIYWIDYILSSSAFIATFALAVYTNNIFIGLLASIFIYRAGAFIHEITHQYNNPRFQVFKAVWDYTMGVVLLQPSARFALPHLTHHATGIFGTAKDPQYPLIRSNKLLAFTIFVILPWLLPIYNLLICTFSLVRHNPLEKILYKNLDFKEDYNEINRLENTYLLLFLCFVFIAPHLVLPLYLISVSGWFLSVLRIPLEHELKQYKETSVYADQKLDSKTHESSIFIFIQPLALRYHTAHHMFPKVPYHNLKKLHKILKVENPDYVPAESP